MIKSVYLITWDDRKQPTKEYFDGFTDYHNFIKANRSNGNHIIDTKFLGEERI